MSDLLRKYLIARDPAHQGLSRYGLATGLSATRGQTWIARRGMVLLLRGTHPASIDDRQPVGAASSSAQTVAEFSWIEQQPSSVYHYQVLPVGPGGVGAVGLSADQAVRVRVDDDGLVASAVPAAPRNLRVLVRPGGVLQLAWSYPVTEHHLRVTAFRVYDDAGLGAGVDYATVVASVTARSSRAGAGDYFWTSAAWPHGTTVHYGVRAVAGSAEEQNTLTAAANADAEGPSAAAITAFTYGDDE